MSMSYITTSVPGWFCEHERDNWSRDKGKSLRLRSPSVEKEVDAIRAGLHTIMRRCGECRRQTEPNVTPKTPHFCYQTNDLIDVQCVERSLAIAQGSARVHSSFGHFVHKHLSVTCACAETYAFSIVANDRVECGAHPLTVVLGLSKAAHLSQPFPFQLDS